MANLRKKAYSNLMKASVAIALVKYKEFAVRMLLLSEFLGTIELSHL
ncbi:MAG: hypothetical protein RMZ69_19695 [Nostoc sp. ChiQUE01a]|nr:hypothetical protein [Nostoc sp. ChiQUE01a]